MIASEEDAYENAIVDLLAKQLESKVHPDGQPWFKNVLRRQNLGKSSRLRDTFKAQFGVQIPLQPEVDLILVGQDNSIRAIEVKHFRTKDGRIKRSYYHGIEQGLALLNLGFDSVALWQVFDGKIDEKDVARYAIRAWKFIRSDLRLPMDYTVFILEGYPKSPRLKIMQAAWNKPGQPLYSLPELASRDFYITFKTQNPLLISPEIQETRRALVHWLDLNS